MDAPSYRMQRESDGDWTVWYVMAGSRSKSDVVFTGHKAACRAYIRRADRARSRATLLRRLQDRAALPGGEIYAEMADALAARTV